MGDGQLINKISMCAEASGYVRSMQASRSAEALLQNAMLALG